MPVAFLFRFLADSSLRPTPISVKYWPVSVRIVDKARLSLTGHFGGRNIHLQRPAISRFNGSPAVLD